MDKESAKKLIRNTFQNSFDKIDFIYFIKNLLNRYDESKAFHLHGCYIPDSFKDYIKSYERIGTYTDPEGEKIDVLIVHLKSETTIDRARTAQRNFIARYLKERGEKDAGLVAFVSPREEDWRFSFVKMEYKFKKTPKGDVKVKEEFTPARRYSFLVGKNESSHTAQSCFVDILINDTHNLKLNEIEEAFNIEKVTKEFYEKYRNLFLQVKDTLNEIVKKDEEIRQEFQEKGVNVVDFSKKLLGQIVFLYFLQKKGWFGVKEGQKWGTGSKHFLRELFEKKHCHYKNFFNDVLEPLFYEALRNDRSYDDHYFSYFNCKIPFLNGGLFDPLNDYNWAKTDILLPDTLFSNQIKTKEGDIGTGILDVFDRYNFTVKEDEPLEKEVAVDPEMLGKVFENLLEVKDRKSKGTYYTPREIVHYMCQQSLINYLDTEVNSKQKSRNKAEKIQMKLLGKPDPIQQSLIIEKDSNIISKGDIEKLIKYGDTTIENDNHVATKGEETKTYSFKLPENIRKNAEIIDEALKNIRVCDPAIGSGAFPVGMMNEIIRARNALTSYLLLREAEATKQSRTIYNFKRHTIQNCLYGVDIDPGAVEIAKLRLWLSLIVDEEDINKIKPLPNLDYKIMQGNSLISEFMGIDLDNDKQNNEKEKLFSIDETKELYEMLKVKKDELLNQPNINKKKILKKEIENLIINIFELKLQKQKSDYFKKEREIEEKWERHPVKEEREREIKIEKDMLSRKTGFNLEEAEKQLRQYTSNQKIRPFFPWKLYFSEVFQEKDGFDVVIANPPYGFRNVLSKEEKKYFRKNKGFQFPSGDIAELFIIFSIKKLVHSYGILTFIIPKKSLYGESWREVRQIWVSNRLVYLMDASKAFENVLLEQVSFSIIRAPNNNENISVGALNQYEDRIEVFGPFSLNNIFSNDYKNAQIYRGMYPESLLEKIMKDSIANTKQLVKGVIGLSNITSYLTFQNKSNYPCVKGIDILRYGLKQNRYLRTEKAKDYLSLFKEDKIVAQKIIAHIQNPFPHILITMFYDDAKRLISDTCVEIKVLSHKLDKKFLLAYYQSSFCNWYAYNFIYNRAIRTMDFINYYITQIPIPKLVIEYPGKQEPTISLVNKIFAITKNDDYLANSVKQVKVKEYERQIDQMVYKLYGLNEEEIKIVEKNK